MSQKQIKGNMANLLTYMGNLYRNPPDAIKEYVSNFIDEWRKYPEISRCEVVFTLSANKIVISGNTPGMDQEEFEAALQRVADSMKKNIGVPQIGELGIGLFAFNQIGSVCNVYSKKKKGLPTVKVKLKTKSDTYEIDTANKGESLSNPGMKIEISNLYQDPTNARNSLSTDKLARVFSEKFDSYLRKNILRITILVNNNITVVEPIKLSLPEIGVSYKQIRLKKNSDRIIENHFWFDPEGRSTVSIRHRGIPIIEDMKTVTSFDSAYASGFIKGYIDADFLVPLPSRTAFQENKDYEYLLWELELLNPALDAEIKAHQGKEEAKKLSEAENRAIQLAKEILGGDEFSSLELIMGMVRRCIKTGGGGTGTHPNKRSDKTILTPGDRKDVEGKRISMRVVPFEGSPQKHSRNNNGTIEVNSLNADFVYEMNKSQSRQIQYFVEVIGKENISFNDKSKWLDDYLEKQLSFSFKARRLLDKKGK